MAVEVGTAYVSVLADTTKLESTVTSAMNNVAKSAQKAGAEAGGRLADAASKTLRSGWRPDQDIMAGLPNTKLDRVGGRIGQLIGKGVVTGLKAQRIGREFGDSFAQGAGSVGLGRVVAGWKQDLAGQSNKIGFLAGKALSTGLTAAAAAGAAGVTMALKGGFDRLLALDTAQNKLKALLRSQGRDVKEAEKVRDDVLAVVEGTPFSLDDGFAVAVQAMGAGVKDIKGFLTDIGDAAGFAGTDLSRMGLIFNQIVAKGKLTGEETMQLMEAGIPARSWIQKSFDLTNEQFDEMQRNGLVTIDMLRTAIQQNASGMAQELGNTLQGSIDNMRTSVAKLGANFLSAVFGGEGGNDVESMKDAVQRITEYLNRMSDWVNDNREEIRSFFETMWSAASDVVDVLGSIASTLQEHPALIEAVVTAFAAWNGLKFTGLLAALGDSKSGMGVLGKLGAIILAVETIDRFMNRLESKPVNAGPDWGGMGAYTLGGAAVGGKIGGVPGALIGGGAGAVLSPTLDLALGGAAAQNGVIYPGTGIPTPGSGQTPTVGGIPIPGLGSGKPPGTAGQGYMNSAQASAYLNQVAPLSHDLVRAKAAEFGLQVTSAYRPGDPGYHGSGRALDLSNGSGNTPQMEAFAAYMANNYGAQLAELIYDSPTFQRSIKNGVVNPGVYGQSTLSQHRNHVHLAFASGGGVSGAGSSTSDSIPAMLSDGEHVLSAKDVAKMGGQGGVYRFRAALHRAEGGPITDEELEKLLAEGAPHGQQAGEQPGPPPQEGKPEEPNFLAELVRSQGFTPSTGSGKAGTSSLAQFIGMGADVVGGLIDTGSSLLQTATSAAITAGAAAGTFGAGAAAAPAASAVANYGIQLGAAQLKRISNYWFELGGIGADALIAQLFPIGGPPRAIGYDYTGFVPQVGVMGAATTTLEKMGEKAINDYFKPEQPAEPGTPPGPAGPAEPPPQMQAPLAAEAFNPEDPMGLWPKVFDTGGVLEPGRAAVNLSSRPEAVLTSEQWDAMTKVSPRGGDAPLVKIDAIYGMSPEDVANQIEAKQKLAAMRFTGRPY